MYSFQLTVVALEKADTYCTAAEEMKLVRAQNQEYEEIDKVIHTEDVRNIRQVPASRGGSEILLD